jgi:hypothetical protein
MVHEEDMMTSHSSLDAPGNMSKTFEMSEKVGMTLLENCRFVFTARKDGHDSRRAAV